MKTELEKKEEHQEAEECKPMMLKELEKLQVIGGTAAQTKDEAMKITMGNCTVYCPGTIY